MATPDTPLWLIRVEETHIVLLRRMRAAWVPFESGVPYLDILEPYGSTDPIGDARRLLAQEGIPVELAEAELLHVEALIRLPVLLGAGELAPGRYGERTLREEQITLLRHLRVGTDVNPLVDLAVNCKRPYGELTAFEYDMAALLGVVPEGPDRSLSAAQSQRLYGVHRSLEGALQTWLEHAALASGAYEAQPDGRYRKVESSERIAIVELSRRPATEALIEAVKTGNLPEARRLLERAADPREQDASGQTAMAYAVARKDLAAVKLLLASGVGLNARYGKARATALCYAAMAGAMEIFEYLLAQGADVSIAAASGTTPLGLATLYGRAEIVGRVEAMGLKEPVSLGVQSYFGEAEKEAFRRLGIASGAIVANVFLRSTADRLGLEIDDRIVAVDGKDASNFEELRSILAGKEYGQEIRVSFIRRSEPLEATAKMGPKISEPVYKFKASPKER